MTPRQGSPASVSGLVEGIGPFRGYLGARVASRQCSRYAGGLLAPRTDVREIYMEQRSYYHRRGCQRGFTIARVHSYGKGIAGVGFAAADWELRTARPFWPSLTIGGGYAMRRSV